MKRSVWKRLKTGDMIESLGGHRYILARPIGRGGWVAIRTVVASDPDQWRKVTSGRP